MEVICVIAVRSEVIDAELHGLRLSGALRLFAAMSGITRSRSILFALLAVFQVIMTSKTLRGVAAQQQSTAHILLYTATADFRHDSIPTAIQVLHNQSTSNGGSFNVRFDATEDRAQFTDGNLGGYDAVMFVSTTGEGAFYSCPGIRLPLH